MIKGIAFDKDGTLINYEKYWVPITAAVTREVLLSYSAEELCPRALEALGIRKDGTVDLNGILCHATYRDVSDLYFRLLSEKGIAVCADTLYRETAELFKELRHLGICELICPGVADLLKGLKGQGIALALITTDDRDGARRTLAPLGVYGLFDFVITGDEVHPKKPDPYWLEYFMREAGLVPDEVLMVGDTPTDMEFANRAGVRGVAVSQNAENRRVLSSLADVTIPDISHLPLVLPSFK